jgi:RNA-directed DNA polymerase
LAILECPTISRPVVEVQLSEDAAQTTDVRVLGYPRFNIGNDVTIIHGRVIRIQAHHGTQQLITDAVINEGNSGGPVLNSKNQVVAIAARGRNVTDNICVYVRHCSDTQAIEPAPVIVPLLEA